MTLLYELAPVPKWYFRDLFGKPLGAGYMLAFSSLNHAIQKLVYTDATGTTPWNSPSAPKILFDLNGSQGPFYWETDPDDPTDLYFLEFYDVNNVFQFSIDKYGPPNDGSGTTKKNQNILKNLVINNTMINNFGSSTLPIGKTELKIAPGAHLGLTKTSSNYGPDIWFYKNNTSATDQLEFINFTAGSNELTGDITPTQFLRYTCTNTPVGETFKYIQFPITQGVQNLSGSTVTYTIWARCNSGANSLKISTAQFFGDGASPSAPVISTAQTFMLTGAWTQYSITVTIPSITGKIIGECGNDGLFIQIGYPLGAATSIDFIKLCDYNGTVSSPAEILQYETDDMIGATIHSPRTGFAQFAFSDDLVPFGWVSANNGSIGIGAPAQNIMNTFPLYNFLYSKCTQTVATVNGGRSGNVVTDFINPTKYMSLPDTLGRVIAVENSRIPAPQTFTVNHGVNPNNLILTSSTNYDTGSPLQVLNTGGALPSGLTANTVYFCVFVDATHIALATTVENAFAGSPLIDLIDNGSGTNTVQNALGLIEGMSTVTLTANNIPPLTSDSDYITNVAGTDVTITNAGANTKTQNGINGGSPTTPVNIIQPTIFMNLFYKL